MNPDETTPIARPAETSPPPKPGWSLNRKLMIGAVLGAVLPLVAVITFSTDLARTGLQTAAQELLQVRAKGKAEFIERWFQSRQRDLATQSKSRATAELLVELRESYKRSGEPLYEFVSGAEWESLVHEKGRDLRTFAQLQEYSDLLLIDPKGRVLFSVSQGKDLGRNLLSGVLSNTGVGEACRRTLTTGSPSFSDFGHYAPDGGKPAGFFVDQVLGEDGELLGLLAIQVSPDQIDYALQPHSFDEQGMTQYLLGYSAERDEVLLRSLSITARGPNAGFATEDYGGARYLNRSIDHRQARVWLEECRTGQSKVDPSEAATVYAGPSGTRVLGTHSALDIDGVDWAILVEYEEDLAFATMDALRDYVAAMLILTVLFVSLVASLVTRPIVEPIGQLSAAARRVAEGDLSEIQVAEGDDEIGELSRSFSLMVRGLRDAESRQQAQDWLARGESQMGECIRGELDAAGLTSAVITELAEILGAQVGAFYVVTDGGRLQLSGSYAVHSDQPIIRQFKMGEGVVGQVALSGVPVILEEPRGDQLEICSGLGRIPPRQILVWPLSRDGEIKGVIELGTVAVFEPRCLQLLGRVSESIWMALGVAQSLTLQQRLLQTSQAQAAELRSREEELLASNQSLANETSKLRISEESLQQQSVELQHANEELEEKQEVLELQKQRLEQSGLELRQRADELAQASAYKSQFLANMSHELRTPLNSMLILSGALAGNIDGNLTPEQVAALRVVHTGGQDLLGLINDILDLSKIEAGKMTVHVESVEIRKLIHSLRDQYAPMAIEKGIELLVDVAPSSPPMIATDAQRVGQVLTNLISNGLKFTGSGTVRLSVALAPEGMLFQREELSCSEVVLFAVSDTGIGIPKDKQQAIFESFQQADGSTSRQYGGSGLGLTISREFAEMLGGELQLVSEEGQGCTFTLCLPLNPGWEPEPTPRVCELDSDPLATTSSSVEDDRATLESWEPSVLIIADNADFASLAVEACKQRGFKSLVSANGRSALSLAQEFEPSGILLDPGLPDMDGLELLHELKHNRSTSRIPVHVVVDEDDPGFRRGAHGCLKRPVELNALALAIDEIEACRSFSLQRLLLVDENPIALEEVASRMRTADLLVDVAASGEVGAEKLVNGSYDCLVVNLERDALHAIDMMLGLEADATPLPPVIIHSAAPLKGSDQKALEQFGCSVVVEEACELELLREKVRRSLVSIEADSGPHGGQTRRPPLSPVERLRNRHVLVVDDDMRNSFALSRAFKAVGLRVSQASDGQQALDVLDKDSTVDLVLMDIMMPVMDGYEAIQSIRANPRTADIPVIALTARALVEDRSKCLAAGATDYLSNPVDIDTLLGRMRKWIFQA